VTELISINWPLISLKHDHEFQQNPSTQGKYRLLMSSLSLFIYRVIYSHSLPNVHWRMWVADHDLRHRVAAKEKRPQKTHWYSLLLWISPEMHMNYPLAAVHTKHKKLINWNWNTRNSNSGNVDKKVLLLRRLCFCIKPSIEITIIVRGVNMAYPHSW